MDIINQIEEFEERYNKGMEETKKGEWYVYMVRCRDNSLYTGVTKDISKRTLAHNDGKGAAYTRSRGPVRPVYREAVVDYSTALKREAEIKKFSKADKELLIKSAPSTNRTGG